MDDSSFVPAGSDDLILHKLADRLVHELNCEIFMDVRPLLDEQWTGIPVVAAALVRVLVGCLGSRLRFFVGADELDPQAVYDALARSSGLFLAYDFHEGRAKLGPAARRTQGRTTIGLSPSAKSARWQFDYECCIIHDISTLVTPQFHMLENIAYHMEQLTEDLASNAVTACVSEATAQDLVAYLGVPPERLVVAYNGISWRQQDLQIAQSEVDLAAVEPFFLILGTREPRKNIALVFELLSTYPELLRSHRFVFTGKAGWLLESHPIPPALQWAVNSGQIFFTGFLSDAEKCKLLMAAEATIYPSLFEGFGLPVIESLSVGTPCIASCSSSIPEAGGALCTYFDPYSVLDLHRAIRELIRAKPKYNADFRAACIASVEKFTWSRAASDILGALETQIRQSPPSRHI